MELFTTTIPEGAGEEVEEAIPEEIELFQEIGKGSTGQVFRGSWKGQVVAVKQVHHEDGWGPENPASPFSRELFVLSRAKHPNIVKLMAKMTVSHPAAFILEYCRGGSCADYIHVQVSDDKPLSWVQTFRIAKQAASAMVHLHGFDPPIIHRDLKSMNLLLEEPIVGPETVPFTKLCDFGVSRAKSQGEEGMTARATDDSWPMMTKAVGTCNWVAPEVFRGHSYDEKIDVYAFAMVLFELIFHELPFEDSDPIEIATLVTYGRRPSLEDPPPGCPPTLLELVERCWAHNPEYRPPFSEVFTFLQQFPG